MQQMQQWELDKANLLNFICVETHLCETMLDLGDDFSQFFLKMNN